MCGIAGFTGPAAAGEESGRVARAMLRAIGHRGPEGVHHTTRAGTTLAHCKLAFVDPADGTQPLVSGSGRSAIVFNGEIYNHGALREELEAEGVRLSTKSDTEVLLELYERRGPDCLARLRGMFAVAIHDRRAGGLLLARDPLGQKPLFYFRTPGGVVFASELGGLLAHPACPRELDVEALARYLQFGAFPAPTSALAGVAKVRPGTYRWFDGGGRSEVTYWRLPASEPAYGGPPAVIAERVESALIRAIRRRLSTTDLPVGVLLSGGLDSSLVASLADEMTEGGTETFSVGFDERSFDESRHAEEVAGRLRADHHHLRLSAEDLAGAFGRYYPQLDEPLADPSLLPMLILCRQARARVRAVLSGDGADEFALGYRFFQVAKVLEACHGLVPAGLAGRLERVLRRLPPSRQNLGFGQALTLVCRGADSPPESRYYESTSAFNRSERERLFRPEAWERVSSSDVYDELARFVAGTAADGLGRTQAGIVAHFLRDVILTKVDRGSMLHSLEIRSPFLDGDLIAVLARVPERLKLRGLEAKHVLRRLARRRLPRRIAQRTKLGFRVPVAGLLAGELSNAVRDLLAEERLRHHDLFDPRYVSLLVEEHLSRRRDHHRKLWSLLCFQVWYDRHLRPAGGRPAAEVSR